MLFRSCWFFHYRTEHLQDDYRFSRAVVNAVTSKYYSEALAAYTAAYDGTGPLLQVLPEREDFAEDLAGMSISG